LNNDFLCDGPDSESIYWLSKRKCKARERKDEEQQPVQGSNIRAGVSAKGVGLFIASNATAS
jgi:hypothetical protein